MDLIALNNRITELLADGETFDGIMADELIANLPINSRRRNWSFRAAGKFNERSQGQRLAAAGGIGNVPGDENPQWRKIDTSGDWMHIGMYRVQHESGTIHFRTATPSNPLEERGQALLHYDRHGHATRMEGSYERNITFWRVNFALVMYRPWKRRA